MEVRDHGITWPYLPVKLDPAAFLDDLKVKVLPHTHAGWDLGLLEVTNQPLGWSNSVSLLVHGDERAVLRINGEGNGEGSEKLVDRDSEAETMMLLSKTGLCAPLFCQLENGLLYGYAPGRSLELGDVRETRIMRGVAAAMVRLHALPLTPSGRVQQHLPSSSATWQHLSSSGGTQQPLLLWDKFDSWLDTLPGDLDKNAEFVSRIGTLERLRAESQWLKRQTSDTTSPLVFCHNDVNKPNVIYDEATGNFTFVDFEYAGPNYLAFDLGNWLGETEIELDHYPSDEYCRQWLGMYLEEAKKLRTHMKTVELRVGEKGSKEVRSDDNTEAGKRNRGERGGTASQERKSTDDQEEGNQKSTESRESCKKTEARDRSGTSRDKSCAEEGGYGSELDSLQREVLLFSLVSHLLWCVWSLYQSQHSKLDHDYMNYAAERHSLFVRYQKKFCKMYLP